MVEDPRMSITSRENMMRKNWEDLLRKNDFKTHLNDEKLRKSVCKLSQVSDLVFKTEQMQEVTFSLFLRPLYSFSFPRPFSGGAPSFFACLELCGGSEPSLFPPLPSLSPFFSSLFSSSPSLTLHTPPKT